LIWRPILADKISIAEVKRGDVDLVDILKINALMDMQEAIEERAIERQRQQRNKGR
jgi:hypothetical protein